MMRAVESKSGGTIGNRPWLVAESRLPFPPASHWLLVTCLVGVDYFSTLAYQASITFKAAGLLGPLATLVVVAMTLLGALPVYYYVAGRSPHGQSSIALVERLVRGWGGKTLVLFLLGFAATDFVVTKTLSTAAAAEHVIHSENPDWQHGLDVVIAHVSRAIHDYCGPEISKFFSRQLIVTILLGTLSFIFWALIHKGFNEKATRWAAGVVTVYLALNAVIIGCGLKYLYQRPEIVRGWWEQIERGEWHTSAHPLEGTAGWAIAIACLLVFPKLSLGLSGLEMTVIAMREVKGDPTDDAKRAPGRIRNTRKVMVLAALVMSLFLLGSITVTTLLIPAEQFAPGGAANDRALAYLAHGGRLTTGEDGAAASLIFGHWFGALYDLASVLILCLAGTSVITGLTTLLPQFLLKFGMQFKWVHTWGILFGVFALVNLVVTLAFHADVDDQRGAYATGVLMLITSACLVTVADRWPNAGRYRWLRLPWGYGLISLAFLATTVAVVVTTPAGLLISICFIVIILGSSILSRALRASELRTTGAEFVDEASRELWENMQQLDWPLLVPHRPGRISRHEKEATLRQEHQLAPDLDMVFIEVHVDDPSDFYQTLLLRVFREEHLYVVQVERCVSVAHAIAAIALELSKGGRPSALHFGWTEMSVLEESWSFLAFGEGNVPWKVRELMALEQPDAAKRPRVVVG
jgi:hypothetical protein